MRLLLIMDPVDRVVPARDTSLALARAAEARGHEVHHCLAADVSHAGGTIHVRSSAVRSVVGHPHGMELGPRTARPIRGFDAAFIRGDPPFDHDYLTLTLLLDRAADEVVVVNHPRGLRDANEHLYPLRFAPLTPPTLVTADRQAIVAFAAECDGIVVKPVDGHAGRGVVRLLPSDLNTRSLLDSMTAFGTRAVVVQPFLPAVHAGDTRILLLDGQPLGAILRVPAADDFRATIARGEVRATELTAADHRIVDGIRDALHRDGLWFVGIDVIDGQLIEVNVTSPTGLVQLAELTGTDPATTVIDALEALVRGDRTRHRPPESTTRKSPA